MRQRRKECGPFPLNSDRFFSCLGNRTRLFSLLLLHRHGELCVCELMAALEDHQSRVSRHLSQLRSCGLVLDERRGQWVFYRLHPELPAWCCHVLEHAAVAEAKTLRVMEDRLRRGADQSRKETASA